MTPEIAVDLVTGALQVVMLLVLVLVVPGLVPYRSVWTGIGVLAAEVALLVHLSFRVRKRIGVPMWRRIHWLTYVAFAGAAIHGIASGTDSGSTWAMASSASPQAYASRASPARRQTA